MNSDQEWARQLFHQAVPVLPEPADRVAQVRARIRRKRAAVAAVTAAALGVVFAVSAPTLFTGSGGQGLPAADAAPSTAKVSTAGCGGSAAAGQPAQLDQVAHRLRNTAQDRFADSFANLEITDRIRVFRKPSRAFDTWVTTEFAADCVELADTPVSAVDMQRILDEVESDREYWRRQGIVLNELSVDVQGTIHVGVDTGDVAKAEKMFPARYPARAVIRKQGAVPPAIGSPD